MKLDILVLTPRGPWGHRTDGTNATTQEHRLPFTGSGAIPICDKCLGSWRLHSLQRPGRADMSTQTHMKTPGFKKWGTFLELDFYLLIFHMDRPEPSSVTTAQTQTAFQLINSLSVEFPRGNMCLRVLTWLRAETLRHADTLQLKAL